MGPGTERPDGGLVESQANSSDESWENEKHEVVDATRFSSVRNFHISLSTLVGAQFCLPRLTVIDAKITHRLRRIHMHFQW